MKRFIFPLALTALFAMTSCDVHQFPIEPEKEPLRVILDLDFSTEMPLYKVVEYPDDTSQSTSTRSQADYQVRYTVKIFSTAENSRAKTISRSDADYTTTVYRPVSDDLSTQIEIEVPEGSYTAMVWTDYVPINSGIVPFYDINDFSDIHYADLNNYIGSTDMRDAFCGEVQFDIPEPTLIEENIETIPVEMRRPLGKYTIIATDVEQFISRALSRSGQDPSSVIDTRAFDFTKYRIRVVYSGYLPTAFNMFLNKPVDSSLGVYYYSDINLITENEASLAFDYVMVNGTEAKVDIIVQLTDLDGNVLAQSSSIRIPLVRSKLTEVRGKFLTASSSSGVGIITKFDGQYDIEIK